MRNSNRKTPSGVVTYKRPKTNTSLTAAQLRRLTNSTRNLPQTPKQIDVVEVDAYQVGSRRRTAKKPDSAATSARSVLSPTQ